MSPSTMLRLLSAVLLLAGVSACDRAPRSQAAKPAVAAPATPATSASASAVEAGATTTPMPDATVALSGAVRDMPPATTPDSTLGKPAARTPAAAAVRPPPPVDTTPRTAPPGETAAMREFREAQERRDRELLERDMDAARGEVARNEDAPIRDGADDARYPRDEDAAYEDALPPNDPSVDDPPLDEPSLDDPPLDEDLPADDEDLPPDEEDAPPEDEDLRWDPATGTWR